MIRIAQLKKLNEKGFDHFLVAVFVIVIVGIIGTYFYVQSHAASPPWNGALSMGSKTSGYCMDAQNGQLTSGTAVVLNKCNNKVDQHWELSASGYYQNHTAYVIETYAAGKFLCVSNWQQKNVNNNQQRLYKCNGVDPAERFVWNWKTDNHELLNVQTAQAAGNNPVNGKCLDDQFGSKAANNHINIYKCKTTGTYNQDWWEIGNTSTPTSPVPPAPSPSPNPVPSPSGSVTSLIHAGVGTSMCVASSGAAVVLQICDPSNVFQMWTQWKSNPGSPTVVLQNSSTKKFLASPNSNAGTHITTIATQNTNESDWTAGSVTTGNQLEIGVFAGFPCLDAPSGTPNTALVLATCANSPNQSFTIPIPYHG